MYYGESNMSGLQKYISTIDNFELLKKNEFDVLFNQFKNGDMKAKQKLINHNLRLVVNIARKFENSDENKLLDLIQEGSLGLIRAIELFDNERGIHFSTFAFRWIKYKIGESFGSSTQASYVPSHIKKIARKIHKIEKELNSKSLSEKFESDVLNEYNNTTEKQLTESEFVRIKALNTLSVSMDAPISDKENSVNVHNFMSSEKNSVEENMSMKDLAKWVEVKLNDLPENQKKAIGSYFGINRNTDRKFKEVGEEIGCTGSRAQQLVKEGIRRLQKMAETENVELSML
jgi:RNA polymerase sigma factor (sigma-70 family)